GEATLVGLEQTPRNKDLQPENRIEIVQAQVMTAEEATNRKAVLDKTFTQASSVNFSLGTFVAILLISVACFLFKSRLNTLMLRSLNLVIAFLASFAIFVLFTPMTRTTPLLGGGL